MGNRIGSEAAKGLLKKLLPLLGAVSAGALAGFLLLRVVPPSGRPAEPPIAAVREESAAAGLLRGLLEGLMDSRPSGVGEKDFSRMSPDERHGFYSAMGGGMANPKPTVL